MDDSTYTKYPGKFIGTKRRFEVPGLSRGNGEFLGEDHRVSV